MGNSEKNGYEWIYRVHRIMDTLGINGMTVIMSIVMLIILLIDGYGNLFYIIMFSVGCGFISAFIIIIAWAFFTGLGKTVQTGIIILLIAAFFETTGIIDIP